MPTPALSVSAASPNASLDQVLVVLATSGDDGPSLALPDGADAAAIGLGAVELPALGFTGAAGDLARVPGPGGLIAVVGAGGTADADAVRGAAAVAVRRLTGSDRVAIVAPSADPAVVAAALEGAALGAYRFTEYRSATLAAQKAPAQHATVLAAGDHDDAVRRATAIADAVALVRDLVNVPANDLGPADLADRAVAAATAAGATATVWEPDALAQEGFGGILGVGVGSVRGPRLVRLTWAPEGATASVALVGKGITFDSGGLSLKPPTAMVGMKSDMAGAATVAAALAAAATLDLQVAVTAWLCIAENMPSGSAIRPGDVLRIRGGRTVEVLNTDAEGRLVLADGLVRASEDGPDLIVDVATLTGAVITALGNRYTGLMGDGDAVARVQTAAKRAGELVWHLPLPEELRTILNSDIADIANVKIGNSAGGALVAGQFLKEFVGERDGVRIPWVHLDIAGSSMNGGSPYGATGSGPTGVAVRTLVALLEDTAGRTA